MTTITIKHPPQDIKEAITPTDTLLVVDAMTGQEAANLVKTFNDVASISGAVLTKADGDSRGGAALSVYEVSGRPIKFVGTGEKLEALEPFYPDRMAQRILGATCCLMAGDGFLMVVFWELLMVFGKQPPGFACVSSWRVLCEHLCNAVVCFVSSTDLSGDCLSVLVDMHLLQAWVTC